MLMVVAGAERAGTTEICFPRVPFFCGFDWSQSYKFLHIAWFPIHSAFPTHIAYPCFFITWNGRDGFCERTDSRAVYI